MFDPGVISAQRPRLGGETGVPMFDPGVISAQRPRLGGETGVLVNAPLMISDDCQEPTLSRPRKTSNRPLRATSR